MLQPMTQRELDLLKELARRYATGLSSDPLSREDTDKLLSQLEITEDLANKLARNRPSR